MSVDSRLRVRLESQIYEKTLADHHDQPGFAWEIFVGCKSYKLSPERATAPKWSEAPLKKQHTSSPEGA